MNRIEPQQPIVSPLFPRSVVAAVVFTALYMAASAFTAIARGNLEFLFYGATMLLIIGLLLWAHWRVRFSGGVIWGLTIWGALHMAGGLMPVPAAWAQGEAPAVLYSLWLMPFGVEEGWLKYDNAIHALGFGVMAWVCWQALRGAVEPHMHARLRPSLGLLTLCVAGAMGFGALNEIIEFTATRLTDTNVGGYFNTSLDLIANVVGALCAAVMIRLSDGKDHVPAHHG